MKSSAEDLFQVFQATDEADAFLALLDGESARYHDYVFRMTGNEHAARETLTALAEFGLATGRSHQTSGDLRIALFSEARTINRREWNAPTHRMTEIADDVHSELKSLGLDRLDRAFRSLPGPEREVLILVSQNGFSLNEAAAIMGVSDEQVAEWRERGESMLRLVVGEEGDFVSGLQRLPFAGSAVFSEHSTIALSQVINTVRKVKPGFKAHFPLGRILFFTVLSAAIGAGIYFLLQ